MFLCLAEVATGTALLLSAIIAGVGTAASVALQPKPPKPTPPPDPDIALQEEIKKQQAADDVRARAIRAQRIYDDQFSRDPGIKI